MSKDTVAQLTEALRELAATTGDPVIYDLLRMLEDAGGDWISVGDISGSTAVAIGRNIQIVVNQVNLPTEMREALNAYRRCQGGV